MEDASKKTALRMIPYGLYVLTTEHQGEVAAATINWVTQTSFQPPLVAIGVKAESGVHALVKQSGSFALNILGKGQNGAAFTFFKPAVLEGAEISGEPFEPGASGAPILDSVPAYLECKLIDTIERGDHSLFVGEVVEAVVREQPEGRADDATLWLKDLGENIFYGG